MMVFHELAYEGYVLTDGTGAGLTVYSDPRLMELLGSVDVLHVSGYAAPATGTTPTLTVAIDFSNDRSYFFPLNLFVPVINNVSLSTSSETLFQGVNDNPELAHLAYGRLGIFMTGTDARAFVRIWVTGRDLSRRAAGSRAMRSLSLA